MGISINFKIVCEKKGAEEFELNGCMLSSLIYAGIQYNHRKSYNGPTKMAAVKNRVVARPLFSRYDLAENVVDWSMVNEGIGIGAQKRWRVPSTLTRVGTLLRVAATRRYSLVV